MPRTPQCKILMPETLRAACEKQAKKNGVTMSEWIRKTLADAVPKREAKKIPQVVMGRPVVTGKDAK